jgi:Outer membrane protein beta-barrel domain
MKRKHLFVQHSCTLLFIAFFTAALSAQTLKVGVQGGANMSKFVLSSTLDFDYMEDFRFLLGSQVNVFVENKFNNLPMSISLEPGIVMKGFNTSVVTSSQTSDRVNFRLTYLNLPVVFNYYITPKLGVQAGPEVNYLVYAASDGQKNEFLKDYTEKAEIAGMVGANYQLFEKWTLGARYTHGITAAQKNVYTLDDGTEEQRTGLRNISAQLYVRYCIN